MPRGCKNVTFVKLTSNSKIPTMAHDNDAGNDFYSAEDVTIRPGQRVAVSTGIAWVPPTPPPGKKYALIVQSRSGMAFKNNCEASNAGVVDEGYRGNIKILLQNFSTTPIQIKKGDKIAQGIIYELPKMTIKEGSTEDLTETSRGTKGFGSTDAN